MPERHQLRILLLQIRDEALTRQEELDSFARFSGLENSQFTILNLFDTPEFDPAVVLDYDALYVGGSSEASVLEPDHYPFVIPAQHLLNYCLEHAVPVFASCFGHQLAVKALGGHVFRDDHEFEMGTLPISLTAAASDDLLFHDTPNPFMAVSVHRERATELPKGCVLLAETGACIHSFRVKGKPFWTTQFHPEVSKSILISRLTIFKDKYTDGDGHLQQVLDSAVETPESNNLLKKFVDRVLLAGEGLN
ncbi:type 1 glutamine amidotransferase [Motiliproteus sediminis]|uniref:type 1 glutamine amidotransferase n=1 Tax=Motiliproteus sediminis TaxID=1468178 RepID=UPI001AEFA719|nr:type 1 glutamine amidotransferase [Motiliproteus sediminis]